MVRNQGGWVAAEGEAEGKQGNPGKAGQNLSYMVTKV